MSAQVKEKWSLNARCNQKRAPSTLNVGTEFLRLSKQTPQPQTLQPTKAGHPMTSGILYSIRRPILKLPITKNISLVIYFRTDFYT